MTAEQFMAIPDPKFRHYAKLRVGGKDVWSRTSLAGLVAAMSPAAVVTVDGLLTNPGDRITAYRWVCRGLSPERAVARVEVGRVIGRNCPPEDVVSGYFDCLSDY